MAAASQPLLPDTANAILHIPDPSYNLSCVHDTPAHLTFFLIFFMFFILTPFKNNPIPPESPAFRVAGLGRLSAGAKMAMKPFVKRVFTIFATNASYLRVLSNFRI